MFKSRRSKTHGRRLVRSVLATAVGTVCAPDLAGGIILYEVGTADLGLASAG